MLSIEQFVKDKVIKREESLFIKDIDDNRLDLEDKINGRTVLVIGGAGSIGSSFIKAILPYKPNSLVVVDINENNLAELSRDLHSTNEIDIPAKYIPYPFSYSSSIFEKLFRQNRGFDIVANFSAHKHVRSEKDIFSVEAMLQNNVLCAKKLLDLLGEFPPEEFFCVSTDKAANPVNVMGASKRIMEDLIFSYSDCFPIKTARFANVAFSNGSLPAGFLFRIQKHQPLSAPKNIKRYFVSLEESGQICMLSCMLGKNREIFFPKLKEVQMMSFDRIATLLLAEYGFEPKECISEDEAIIMASKSEYNSKLYPVFYSNADTSGEKLTEEFYTNDERIELDRFHALGVIVGKNIPDRKRISSMIDELQVSFDSNSSKEDIISIIKDYLPNFNHIETGKMLDEKM